MAKYAPLQQWLTTRRDSLELTMGFGDIEGILEAALPTSAHRHQAWWANDPTHVQAKAWLSAGWRVDALDQRGRRVRFRRA